jgi:hypothetical protein
MSPTDLAIDNHVYPAHVAYGVDGNALGLNFTNVKEHTGPVHYDDDTDVCHVPVSKLKTLMVDYAAWQHSRPPSPPSSALEADLEPLTLDVTVTPASPSFIPPRGFSVSPLDQSCSSSPWSHAPSLPPTRSATPSTSTSPASSRPLSPLPASSATPDDSRSPSPELVSSPEDVPEPLDTEAGEDAPRSKRRRRDRMTAEQHAARQARKRRHKKAKMTPEQLKVEKARTQALLSVSRHAQELCDKSIDTFRLNAHVVRTYPSSTLEYRPFEFVASTDMWHAKPGWTGVRVRADTVTKVNLKHPGRREKIPHIPGYVWPREELVNDWNCDYFDWNGV